MSFVPARVVTLICDVDLPNSAEYTPVCTLNSCSASTDGRTTNVLKFGSVFSTPSRVKRLYCWRWPLTEIDWLARSPPWREFAWPPDPISADTFGLSLTRLR